MLQIERGEEGGRPCSELLNGAPPAPVRTTGQQIQLSPKQRNIFDGLQEINHPQGTTIPKIGNIVDENLRNKMDLYVYVYMLQSTFSSIIDSGTHL